MSTVTSKTIAEKFRLRYWNKSSSSREMLFITHPEVSHRSMIYLNNILCKIEGEVLFYEVDEITLDRFRMMNGYDRLDYLTELKRKANSFNYRKLLW